MHRLRHIYMYIICICAQAPVSPEVATQKAFGRPRASSTRGSLKELKLQPLSSRNLAGLQYIQYTSIHMNAYSK